MKAGDLVGYTGTGEFYLVLWANETYCKLLGFPDNQVFKIEDCFFEVIA